MNPTVDQIVPGLKVRRIPSTTPLSGKIGVCTGNVSTDFYPDCNGGTIGHHAEVVFDLGRGTTTTNWMLLHAITIV